MPLPSPSQERIKSRAIRRLPEPDMVNGIPLSAVPRAPVDSRTEFPSASLLSQDTTTTLTDSLDRTYVVSPDALSAGDVGSTASIFVSNFTVRWPDEGEVVGYPSDTIPNLAFSTLYIVYFDDAERDGTPDSAYFATVSPTKARANINRIIVGSITTPADGAGDTGGGTGGTEPPPDPPDPVDDQAPPIP